MYQGHHPDGSGVQLHSAGPGCPYVLEVYEIRAGAPDSYQVRVRAPDNSIAHAELVPGVPDREKRLEAIGKAQDAQVRLARLYWGARANR